MAEKITLYGKQIKLTLILLAIAALIFGCIHSRYTYGVECYESGNYQESIHIMENMPFGDRIYVKACYQLGLQYMESGEYQLASVTVSSVANGQYSVALREAAGEYIADGDFDSAFGMLSLMEEPQRAEALAQFAQMLADEGKPEQAEMFREGSQTAPGYFYPYCQAASELENLDWSYDIDEALTLIQDLFAQSGNYRDAQNAIRIIDCIRSEDYAQIPALAGFEGGLTGKVWQFALGCWLEEQDSTDEETVLQAQYAIYALGEQKDYDFSNVETALAEYTYRIKTIQTSATEYAIPSLEHIYSNYGNAPAGKILVVRACTDFEEVTPTYGIAFDIMRCLPVEYFPGSMDEVSYVIVLYYTHFDVGYYDNGTRALQEMCFVDVKSLETSEELYVSDLILGPEPRDSVAFYGNHPPEFSSGGAPEISDALREALDTVMVR